MVIAKRLLSPLSIVSGSRPRQSDDLDPAVHANVAAMKVDMSIIWNSREITIFILKMMELLCRDGCFTPNCQR